MASPLSGQAEEVLSRDRHRPHCRAGLCAETCGGEVLAGMPVGPSRLGDYNHVAVGCSHASQLYRSSRRVRLINSNSALQIFDRDGLLHSRVAWLRSFRDRAGQIQPWSGDCSRRVRVIGSTAGSLIQTMARHTGAAAELRSNDPLVAVLGPAKPDPRDGAVGAVEEMARIIAQIRRRWPRVRIQSSARRRYPV